jgi:hypothetical protein
VLGEYLGQAGVSLITPIQERPLFPADAYIIRLATPQDADALRRLAALDAAKPLTGRVLIGELDGEPAAALSLKTNATIADPFQATENLRVHMRMRASALEAVELEPSLRERMLDAVRTHAPVRSTA